MPAEQLSSVSCAVAPYLLEDGRAGKSERAWKRLSRKSRAKFPACVSKARRPKAGALKLRKERKK
eukprot:scaffold732_cov165-Pinguiococcus_pyrenoidosus.AAC.2